jgi:hypothetical protein
MVTWMRARTRGRCGYCGAPFVEGAAILRIEIGPRVVKVRCDVCAGPAPPDLPLDPAPPAPPPPLRGFTHMLPLDFRRRQAGEREPGEEG